MGVLYKKNPSKIKLEDRHSVNYITCLKITVLSQNTTGELAGVRVKVVRVNTCITSFGLIGLEAL